MANDNTNNWPDLVHKVPTLMNNRKHRTIGMRPNEVNLHNTGSVFKRLYPYLGRNRQPPAFTKPAFAIGDHVRVLNPKNKFEKGDRQTASDTVYIIARILFHPILKYKLREDQSNNSDLIAGTYKEAELIKINK